MITLLLAGALLAAPPPQLGVPVVVDRPTQGPVVAILADIRVASDVVGDVVAIGGDVEVARGASVRGDVVALGGRVVGPGSVSGRVASHGSLALLNLGGPSSRPAASSWGVGLLWAGAWLTLGSLVILALPARVRSAGLHLSSAPLRSVAIGVLALLVWLALVVLALAVTASPLGVAFLLVAVSLLLVAKLAGVVAVAWAAGTALAGRLPVAVRGELARTGAALVVLSLLALVPAVGPALWLVANVVGIGAAVGALLESRALAVPLPRFATR